MEKTKFILDSLTAIAQRNPVASSLTGTTTAAGSAALSFLEKAQVWLSAGAALVAIVSGILTIVISLRVLARK